MHWISVRFYEMGDIKRMRIQILAAFSPQALTVELKKNVSFLYLLEAQILKKSQYYKSFDKFLSFRTF